MSLSFDLSIEVSEKYDFNPQTLDKIDQNPWVKNQWPLVYFIENDETRIAYVGESTNAASRIRTHLSNPKKSITLNKISIIGSDKFNKSATLDIESNLIQYMMAEGTYTLLNGNFGLVNHNYYQKDLYKNLFKEVWSKLIDKKAVFKPLAEIENSEIFKFSPYKSLNEDQYKSVIEILKGLGSGDKNRVFVRGSAGTGKTVLATYLMKLLHSDISDVQIEDSNEDALQEINYLHEFQKRHPKAKIGLVIAMTSLRETLEKVFKRIPGLKSSMILNPSDTFKLKEKYDLLIVDEAHRLRQYKNISWRGAFKQNNLKLGLDNSGNELDWILANSKNQLFFYDAAQSVKPSDVDSSHFEKLLGSNDTLKLELSSQMRVMGDDSNNYIQFVNDLLAVKKNKGIFSPKDYDLVVFDSFKDLYNELKEKEKSFGLCRLVAGYSWPWLSDPKKKPKPDPDVIDIELENLKFKWNSLNEDWINSIGARELTEIGSIHTIQGYDLNYTGIIFGKEINYNPTRKCIEIDSTKYFDKYGRIGASDEELKDFIVNIYKTIMYRGIRGTYIYAYNKELQEYLKQHITTHKKENSLRVLKFENVKPYVNAIPLLDISAAAGDFSHMQIHSELTWVELPFNITAKEGYFICKVIGESMNKRIPNGSYCLFRRDDGGSRNGKIVLVESTSIQDSDFGSGYTVKEYYSEKRIVNDEWWHQSITLKPLSQDPAFKNIEIVNDELKNLKVVGIFVCVL